MARTKKINYPKLTATDAIDTAKKISSTFRNNPISMASLANALGHSTEKSGTFVLKVADLRRYGVIDGRGDTVTASELAKTLAFGHTEKEKDDAKKELIFNISLFKQLYDSLGGNRSPSKQEFDIQVQNITNLDRAELAQIADDIRRVYIDAMKQLPLESVQKPSPTGKFSGESTDKLDDLPDSENVTVFRDTGIYLKVRKDKDSLQTAIAFLEIHLKKLEKN